jgi:hypothetical protein
MNSRGYPAPDEKPMLKKPLISSRSATGNARYDNPPFARNAKKENPPCANTPTECLLLPFKEFQISLKWVRRHFFQSGFDPL